MVYNIGIKLEIPQTDGRIFDVSLKGDHVIYILLLWAGLDVFVMLHDVFDVGGF